MDRLKIGIPVRCKLEDDPQGRLYGGTVIYINLRKGWFLVAVKFDLGIIRQAYRIIEGSDYVPDVIL